jgi:methionyl-tRNA formyltransferase
MKFAALGRTQLLFESIRFLRSKGHEPVMIGTCPAAPEYKVNEKDFERLAREIDCLFFCDPGINNSKYVALARKSKAEVAVSVNWQTRIGPEMRGAFRHGVINSHTGDLPRYRGNACANWAILAGEKKVVLTLHRMAAAIDEGPICLQKKFPLAPRMYVADIYRLMEENVPVMFLEVVERLARGKLKFREQSRDPSKSLRCHPRIPGDSRLDWARPAVELDRLVRASAEPFAGAYTFMGSRKVIVWRARPGKLPHPCLGIPGQVIERRKGSGEVLVLAGRGVLALEEIQMEGGPRNRPCDIISSTRLRLGLDLEEEIARLRSEIAALRRLGRK